MHMYGKKCYKRTIHTNRRTDGHTTECMYMLHSRKLCMHLDGPHTFELVDSMHIHTRVDRKNTIRLRAFQSVLKSEIFHNKK